MFVFCFICKNFFQNKTECSALNAYDIRNITNRNFEWICSSCNYDVFPFGNLDSDELIDIFKPNIKNNQPKPTKKTKYKLTPNILVCAQSGRKKLRKSRLPSLKEIP